MVRPVILVAVRFPLRTPGVGTLNRAIELRDRVGNAHLSVLHVNLRHKREHVTRADLAHSVEQKVGSLDNASYHVRTSYLLEEAILSEVTDQKVDYVVIGKDASSRWRQILTRRLHIGVDVESYLRGHVETELVVA